MTRILIFLRTVGHRHSKVDNKSEKKTFDIILYNLKLKNKHFHRPIHPIYPSSFVPANKRSSKNSFVRMVSRRGYRIYNWKMKRLRSGSHFNPDLNINEDKVPMITMVFVLVCLSHVPKISKRYEFLLGFVWRQTNDVMYASDMYEKDWDSFKRQAGTMIQYRTIGKKYSLYSGELFRFKVKLKC